MTIRAWKIECDDIDSHGQCVVFAESRDEARRRDSRDCDCEFTKLRIVRAKDFDSLAPGPVKTCDYLANGWFFWCNHCGKPCYEGGSTILIDDRVFCNIDCVNGCRCGYPTDVSSYHESIIELCRDIDDYLAANPHGDQR